MPDDLTAKPPIPPLVTMGDPRLAQPSAPVDLARIATPEFQAQLHTLTHALVEYLGIGIAAPQVGWFERFFLMLLEREGPDDEPEQELQVWINPEIVSTSEEHAWAWEGCLSVPGLRGWVRRPAAVAVRGYNARGEQVSAEFRGWEARVFQHEYDHLDGMLFPYRVADAHHLVMTPLLEQRESWPADWPAPGARDAPLGDVVPEDDLG
ncbi:MAG TPA: peptide deformylase [bacterium]|nr:peptide deformylase [bacterium]